MPTDEPRDADARPRLAITMGDAAGVGPEVIAAAWVSARLHELCLPLVVGDAAVMHRAVQLRCGDSVQVLEVGNPQEARPSASLLPVLNSKKHTNALPRSVSDVPPGMVDARAGAAAYDAILTAGELALAGEVDGIVTAPIHKKSLREAGVEFPGHTELFAQMCGVEEFAMMLYRPTPPAEMERQQREGRRVSPGLGVAHVTLHMALRDVFDHLTPAAIVEKAKLLDRMLSDLHGQCGTDEHWKQAAGGTRRVGTLEAGSTSRDRAPRIGVAALNPHGGESGLFGNEESEIIAPAVDEAKNSGLDIHGPFPADTLFRHAAAGAFDGVVAMYHDQGHIALKLLDMHSAVNVTLGLPIVRTSVAHGTAFDIAWQGKAAPDSLLQAIEVAAKLARARSLRPSAPGRS